ncbi:MAG TPA: GNAT family N-acetyltransferase [Candidatus Paceibacterota bacterium]
MDKQKIGKIVGEKIYLRPVAMSDVTERYCSWLNDPEVNKYLETRSCNMDELREYVREKTEDPDILFCGIFDKETDIHIGNVKLEPIDWANKKTVFGIMIGDREYWGKGLGTEATRLISDYALNELGMNEVELGVITDNIKASKAYERAGFKQIQFNPKSINHDGIFYDEIVMVKNKETKA